MLERHPFFYYMREGWELLNYHMVRIELPIEMGVDIRRIEYLLRMKVANSCVSLLNQKRYRGRNAVVIDWFALARTLKVYGFDAEPTDNGIFMSQLGLFLSVTHDRDIPVLRGESIAR